jgi:uncharacterized membrane protein
VLETRVVLDWLHLVALAIGLGGLWSRARALHDSLRNTGDSRALHRAYVGDAWWTTAVVLWLVTGIWRLTSGSENTGGYYSTELGFFLKMALFIAVIALEVWPTTMVVRWRLKRVEPDVRDAGRIEAISYVQCALVVGIVFTVAAMGTPRTDPSPPPARVAEQPKAIQPEAAGEVERVVPSGTETVTNADIALLTHELAMPLRGIDPDSLRSSFNALRSGGLRRHEALDIMSPRSTPILSAAKGRILKLFTSVAGGLMIYATDSSERFILMYAHLDHYAPGARDGAPLERGQLIGYVGSTGNASATAPHLHFAILRSADVKRWSKGAPIDPLPVLRAAESADHAP